MPRLSVFLTWGCLILFVAAGLGCVGGLFGTKPDNWNEIEDGLTEDEVIQLIGKPGLITPHGAGKLIYYYPASKSANCAKDRKSCTPVVFEKDASWVWVVWISSPHHKNPEPRSRVPLLQPLKPPRPHLRP